MGKTHKKKPNDFLYNCFVYTEILTTMCFTCLLSSGLVQLMCMASFIFNLKTELSLSMIWNEEISDFSLHIGFSSRCLKMCEDFCVRCSFTLSWRCLQVSPTYPIWQLAQVYLYTTEDLRTWGMLSLDEKKLEILHGEKTNWILVFLQNSLHNLFIFCCVNFENFPT